MFTQLINKNKSSFIVDHISNIEADEDAIELRYWLRSKIGVFNTYVTYRVVVFRFYLWMSSKGIKLKTANRRDIIDYLEFIKNPPESWCGSRHHFTHPEWRPFRHKLSTRSIQFNMQLIRQMFIDLVESEYITKSPFPSNLKYSYTTKDLPMERYLTIDEYKEIHNYINLLPENTQVELDFKVRINWIIIILIYTGTRRSEIAKAKMSDIIVKNDRLWLKVIGKGNKYGEIPILPELEDSLNQYRKFYNLPKISSRQKSESHIPLIIKSKLNNDYYGMSSASILYNIKKMCKGLAKITPNKELANKLMKVSPHWFRHTSATLQVNAGIDLRIVQKNLRHTSIETTMIYQHVQQDHQHDETSTKFKI